MDMFNIKPLSKDEWSPDTLTGVEATGVEGGSPATPTDIACTSSEERALRRITGRWGAEWLS